MSTLTYEDLVKVHDSLVNLSTAKINAVKELFKIFNADYERGDKLVISSELLSDETVRLCLTDRVTSSKYVPKMSCIVLKGNAVKTVPLEFNTGSFRHVFKSPTFPFNPDS